MDFDHLDLTDDDRELIAQACAVDRVYLAPMDKGLSGSEVWRARWDVGGRRSKDHVLKIGDASKLGQEFEAFDHVASVIDRRLAHVRLYGPSATGRSLLKQELVGGGAVKSFRQAMRPCGGPNAARDLVCRVYEDRMARWHFADVDNRRTEAMTVGDALDWWTTRVAWDAKHTVIACSADTIGRAGIEASLNARFGLTVSDTEDAARDIAASQDDFELGPVHGDLHAQNVLIDQDGAVELIDFRFTSDAKWRAIDFLMLECSLKFLVAPRTGIQDLLDLEAYLEDPDDGLPDVFRSRIYGAELAEIAAAVAQVRDCALRAGAVSSFGQYRRGLVVLTAGLASMPGLNQVFLLHSLAHHATQSEMP